MSAAKPRLFRAPGRVNLIGEHTDYNRGFVLPAAIDLACDVAAVPRGDGVLRVRSADLDQEAEWPATALAEVEPAGDWRDYAAGVARELARLGIALPAADLTVRSTVPLGAGLSSSAAFEVSVALALLGLAGARLSRLDIALLCQRAEADFVGLSCGVMDQFASLFGKRNHAVLVDCRSLEHSLVALPPHVEIVVADSGVQHTLALSAYNERRRECEAAAEAAGKPLRDIEPCEWLEIEPRLPALLAKRARHVVHENARTIDFTAAAERRALDRLGVLMAESHRSLREDFDVSCPELDYLVESAAAVEGVIGARMTGGGFGGCTVNLVHPDQVEQFRMEVSRRYEKRFGVRPRILICKSSDAAAEFAPVPA